MRRLRPLGVVLLCLALTACGGGFRTGGSGGAPAAQGLSFGDVFGGRLDTAAAPRQMAFFEGQVVIAGPRGFCHDPSSKTQDQTGGFVLMGNCATLAQSRRAGQPSIPAVLAASVRPLPPQQRQVLADPLQLNAFVRSPAGQSALSPLGPTRPVVVEETFISDGVFYVLSRAEGVDQTADLSPLNWHAIQDLNGYAVLLSVLPKASEGVTRGQSLRVIRQFVRATGSATGAPRRAAPVPVAAPVAPAAPPPPNGEIPGTEIKRIGIFRRLLG